MTRIKHSYLFHYKQIYSYLKKHLFRIKPLHDGTVFRSRLDAYSSLKSSYFALLGIQS